MVSQNTRQRSSSILPDSGRLAGSGRQLRSAAGNATASVYQSSSVMSSLMDQSFRSCIATQESAASSAPTSDLSGFDAANAFTFIPTPVAPYIAPVVTQPLIPLMTQPGPLHMVLPDGPVVTRGDFLLRRSARAIKKPIPFDEVTPKGPTDSTKTKAALKRKSLATKSDVPVQSSKKRRIDSPLPDTAIAAMPETKPGPGTTTVDEEVLHNRPVDSMLRKRRSRLVTGVATSDVISSTSTFHVEGRSLENQTRLTNIGSDTQSMNWPISSPEGALISNGQVNESPVPDFPVNTEDNGIVHGFTAVTEVNGKKPPVKMDNISHGHPSLILPPTQPTQPVSPIPIYAVEQRAEIPENHEGTMTNSNPMSIESGRSYLTEALKPSHVAILRLRPETLQDAEAKRRENEVLRSLAERLMLKTSADQKPAPLGKPIIWASDRQPLCETLPYYRAYQGACYMSQGLVRSMMFDENGQGQDFMDADVIVSRAGGGMARDKAGTMIQVKSQGENAQIRSMRNNMLHEIPIVVICGQKNMACPSNMPHRYCVLGFFKLTDMIVTMSSKANQKIILFRFEKLNSDKKGWWSPTNVEPIVPLGGLGNPQTLTCPCCGISQEHVYMTWMCLNPACRFYWKTVRGDAPKDLDIECFHPQWLKKRTRWANEDDPFDLRLSDLTCQANLDALYPHSVIRGLCCPKCGQCISRYKYEGWVCSSKGPGDKCDENESKCDFSHTPAAKSLPSCLMRDLTRVIGRGQPISYDTAQGHIKMDHKYEFSHRINRFTLPGLEDEVIVHMIANQKVLEEIRGPDAMLDAMQHEDIGLERRTLGSFGRMSAFSVNHGYPYKFVAAVESRPFEGTSWVITETRTQLNFFAKLALQDQFPDKAFNELLTFCYLEGQKIKYHDDGESGLGPTVATYSLGAPAEMKFRMKRKYYCGITMKTGEGKEIDEDEEEHAVAEDTSVETGTKGTKEVKPSKRLSGLVPYFVAERPLPYTLDFDARLKAFESLQGLSREKVDQRCRELPRELHLIGKGKGTAPPQAISIHLAHGDKIIMHGEKIQKYYEHEVEPMQGHGVRFANTCREILPNHLPPAMRPEVPPDEGTYDGSNLQ
ncbi:hypothetical protein AAFC00_000128 [Neodothiora populina]|uniref:Alpha-ketoglutarate-dependent dioxygenase AlkB-like domain-containing protein n=1 Tax=Neodothiora populina TaxID=2781224 RepID=A0ABR3P2T1_9PEZI